MSHPKTSVRSWCLFRQDPRLREVFAIRVKDFNMTELCRELDIDYFNFKSWKSGRTPKAITQYDLFRLCRRMGLKVSLKVEYEDRGDLD